MSTEDILPKNKLIYVEKNVTKQNGKPGPANINIKTNNTKNKSDVSVELQGKMFNVAANLEVQPETICFGVDYSSSPSAQSSVGANWQINLTNQTENRVGISFSYTTSANQTTTISAGLKPAGIGVVTVIVLAKILSPKIILPPSVSTGPVGTL